MTVADDPYHWLEDDSPEALAWQEAQNAVAEERLSGWRGGEQLRAAVAARRQLSLVFAPQRFGGRWFQLVADEAGRDPVLCVGERPDDCAGELIDPNDWPGTSVSLDWFFPSPDGAHVAFGLSERGSEQSVLRVVETRSGRLLPERISHTSFGVVAWLPDGSGFFYNAGLGPDTERPRKHIFFHRLGDEAPSEPEAAIVREDEEFIFPQVSDDGRWVVAVSSDVEPRPDSIREVAGDGGWQPFLVGCPGTFAGFLHGDRYVAVTTDGAPRGRVVSISLAGPRDRSSWLELVAEGDGVLRSVSLVGEHLAIVDLIETSSRIRIYSLEGRLEDEVPLPGKGTVGLSSGPSHVMNETMVVPDDEALLFVFSGFAHPPAVYRYAIGERQLDELIPPRSDVQGVVADLGRCIGRDGAEVTFWVVRGRDGRQPAPTLLLGYGGWNIAYGLPSYLGALAPFVEAGGTLVLPHLRGGGEHGERHWHEGRLEHKQRTFDDLYAVVEAVVARQISERDRIGLVGASNGGLLAGAALAQRPDLFRVVVPIVPLLDMLHYHRDPYAAEYAIEYGDPRDAAFARILQAYSPYHNVHDGVRYPATLVVCGDADIRCPSWHGRKLVARLEKASVGDRPILLRVVEDAGHLTAATRSAREWLGFVMAELGMMPAS
jgi:prolyl oligopeptidase